MYMMAVPVSLKCEQGGRRSTKSKKTQIWMPFYYIMSMTCIHSAHSLLVYILNIYTCYRYENQWNYDVERCCYDAPVNGFLCLSGF